MTKQVLFLAKQNKQLDQWSPSTNKSAMRGKANPIT